IYLCPSVGMLVAAFWILLGPAAWLFAPGAFEGGGPHPFGLAVPQLWLVGLYCLAPMLVAAFLLGLACSVFYSGTLDPRLAMRRSLVAGTCGLSLTALFVFIENVVTAQISQRFGMPEGTGSGRPAVAACPARAACPGRARRGPGCRRRCAATPPAARPGPPARRRRVAVRAAGPTASRPARPRRGAVRPAAAARRGPRRR